MSTRWYRLDGHAPVAMATTTEQIAEWERRERSLRDGEDCYRVARTELPGGRIVSTVFLGLDHAMMPGSTPILFETMVFPECDVCERYATWDQAAAGHAAVLALASAPDEVNGDDT